MTATAPQLAAFGLLAGMMLLFIWGRVRYDMVAVLAALHGLRGDMTLVTVAHRATTLAACDRLIRVEGGRVSEG